MEEVSGVDQVEVGRFLAQARERAGMKQAELARKIAWSPSVLSRVENGERAVNGSELQTLLEAIGTPESLELQQVLLREWLVVPKPALGHPDQDLLWSAEQVAQELNALREEPDVRRAFERRLSEYISEIQDTAARIVKRNYQIAFIGPIGIGKSTAICHATRLEVPGQDDGPPAPVLEAGAGGITICEVHLRTGPAYGLIIEPRSDDEIRTDVTDFAEHIKAATPQLDEAQDGEGDSQGISKEIERAVRNMAGLKVRREKGSDRKITRRDEAKELGAAMASVRELVVEVLARMELHKRDRRDIWYDASCGKSPLIWLKDTFEGINNGRHSEFTLPKRIEVVVPDQLLGTSDISVRIIDTKGIDRTAARADLEGHLDEPHTLAVLCSGFNDAPAADPRLLLERAKEAGIRTIKTHAVLLVLPRPNEAMAVKDEAGIKVDSAEEGYELKEEQISMALQPLGLADLAIDFFNSHQDDPKELQDFLHGRIALVQQTFRDRMEEITTQARNLLLNQEQAQVHEVVRNAAHMLQSWTEQNTAVGQLNAHVQDSLMEHIGRAYASTIRATVRREGEWPNLSYSHHLGYGARRVAALALGKKIERFAGLCETLAGNPDFEEAKGLLEQAERVLGIAYEDLLRKVQLMGQTSFQDELKIDSSFWQDCLSEWGQGPGYRNRIADNNAEWFRAERRQVIEGELHELIQREWGHALSRMTALLESEN